MFTGIVDDVGTIERAQAGEAGREFRVRCRYQDLQPGESIALNGACLTVREAGPKWFTAAAVDTTLARTTMGGWDVGTRVNLERATRAGDRMGGHLVLGHVDGVGVIRRVAREGTALLIDIGVEADIAALLVPHGSVTVDGVSLTVNVLPAPGVLQVAIVDYTERNTTLGARLAGDRVQVEGDVIGKYVRQLMAPYGRVSGGSD
jgi:riboflavin synthase